MITSSTPPDDSIRVAGTLLRFIRYVDRKLRTTAGDDLGIHELSILGNVDHGTALPSALARTLQVDPARITRTVDQLVSRGYVVRGADALDRRRSPLSLTELGRERLEVGRSAVTSAVSSVMKRLGSTGETYFMEALSDIRSILDEVSVEAASGGSPEGRLTSKRLQV